jgi:hypothetical protein
MLDVDRGDPTCLPCPHGLRNQVEQAPTREVRELEAEEADPARGRNPMIFFTEQGRPPVELP